jgi:GntR family transcriptional regulator
MLEEERVLYCKHGRGRFVAVDRAFIGESITRLRSVTNMLRDRSLVAQARVLSLREQPAGELVAAHLDTEADAPVVRLERIRLAKQQPLIYSLDIFPRAIVNGPLEPQDFEGSLLDIMEERWNVRLDHTQTTISAVQLDSGLSQEIGLPAGAGQLYGVSRTSHLLERLSSRRQVCFSRSTAALLISRASPRR